MAPYRGRFTKSSKGKSPSPRQHCEKQLHRLWLLLPLWLCIALPELLLHLTTATGPTALYNSGMLLPLLFGLVPALLVFTLLLLFPWRKLNYAITLIYSAVCFLLIGSQLVYYRIFSTFYSVYSMSNGGQVLQFMNIILVQIWKNLPILLIMALPLIFLIGPARKLFSFLPPKGWALAAIPLAGAVILQIALVLSLPFFGGTGDLSAYDLYHTNTDSYFSINRLGFLTAFRLDITRQLTGYQPDGSIVLDPPTEPSGTTAPPTAESTQPQSEPSETTEDTTPTEPPYPTGPNVLDIDFTGLMESTTDKSLQEVHQYFSSRTPSEKNAHTGLFEGCNLILIAAESFDGLIVDEERTPTLYKMMHEGYYFTDFYVPNWGTSTTDGEYAFLTGTVPKANVWSFANSVSNAMPLTMCQQLMKLGYSAYAYHGHTYSYYRRNEYLENLGYTYRAYGQGLDVKKTWPESDLEVVDKTTADYVGSEPFTAYYMSISGHQLYTFTGNYIAGKNKDLVADEPYSTNVRAYIACQLELEFSLKLLLERLEEAGVLENTVIVLTPDHYPYGLTNEEMSELAGHTIETNFELYRTGCVIYKPGMTPETIDTPCSHLDLLPTLSNLFGLDFDSRLYMGRDIFSDAEPLVMFRDRSWITDLASYNSNTGEIINFTDTPVTDEYVQRIKNELANRFTVSSRVLDYDYWRILFP